MKSIKDFLLGDSFKKYLSGDQEVQVTFFSSRGLSRHNPGRISTNKKNLSIEVFGSFNLPSWDSFMTLSLGMAIRDNELANAGGAMMEEEALIELNKANSDFEARFSERGKLVFFTYASLSAFKQDIEHCRKIKNTFPSANIIVLTCDCELSKKETQIKSLLDEGVINEAIFTSHCGGQTDMSDILEKVIEIF